MTMPPINQHTVYLLLAVVLGFGFWLLSAGTSGGFLFDDYNNLKGLAALNADPGPESALGYILNGLYSTVGRPVSLASFAAQYSDWPGNPAGFKTVNILIHLLNGWLVFLVVTSLLRLQRNTSTFSWIPLFTATLWLLHPLQISSVLYVVQRMTELSALFTLLGLYLYLVGRASARGTNLRRAYAWMSIGILVGLGLGVLSKENAALMPLLVLVTEYTLLQRVQRPTGWTIWCALFLVLPTLLLAAYLALQFQGFANQYALREFTFAERLLTEARILFDYLGKILLPTPSAFGLLFDDFTLSRSLLDPASTLFAVAGIAGLVTGAFIVRRSQPILAFAILWFFAAHLLESSVIPLELYYEHRNYLALLGPVLALAYYATMLLHKMAQTPLKPVLATCFFAYTGLIVFITHQEARLWGKPLLQAATWATAHPDSRRLAYLYADALLKRGYAENAAELYLEAANKWQDSAVPLVAALEAHCFVTDRAPPAISATRQRLAVQQSEKSELIVFLSRLVNVQSGGDCPNLASADLLELLDTGQHNPNLSNQRRYFLIMKSQIHTAVGDLPAATEALEAAFEFSPRLETAMDVAVLHARQGETQRAREFLLSAQQHPRIGWREKNTMAPGISNLLHEIDRLQKPQIDTP